MQAIQRTSSVGVHGDECLVRQCEGFTLSETVYPADSSLPAHVHDTAYACFVIEGGFEEQAGREARQVGPLSSLVRRSGEAHANRFGRSPVRCLNLAMATAWLGGVNEPWHDRGGAVRADRPASAAGVRLYAALARRADDDDLEHAAVAWVAALTPGSAAECVPSPSLRAVRDRLEDAAAPVPIRELAAIAGCHPVTLARRFRQCWGIGPAEYGRRVRFEKASLAAVGTDEPLSMIAARFGFCDQAHLTRVMTNLAGLPPAAIRAAFRR